MNTFLSSLIDEASNTSGSDHIDDNDGVVVFVDTTYGGGKSVRIDVIGENAQRHIRPSNDVVDVDVDGDDDDGAMDSSKSSHNGGRTAICKGEFEQVDNEDQKRTTEDGSKGGRRVIISKFINEKR
jgi:hypothetical protein